MGGATAARSRRLGHGLMRRLSERLSERVERGEAAGATSWVARGWTWQRREDGRCWRHLWPHRGERVGAPMATSRRVGSGRRGLGPNTRKRLTGDRTRAASLVVC